MTQSLKSSMLVTSALFSALMGAALPSSRWMALYSMAASIVAVLLLRERPSRVEFLITYFALLALGFLMSNFFIEEDGSVSRAGMLILWPILIGTSAVVYRIFRNERNRET